MFFRPSHIGLTAIALIAVASLANLMFHTLGYTTAYSAYEATELAKKFVAEGRVPKDCFKIKTFFPTYPSLGSLRALCVYEYAKEKKDPTACNLILPNEYGLACLSDVGGKLFSERDCYEPSSKEGLYCRGENGGEFAIAKPQVKNCSSYNRTDVVEWCHFARSEKLSGINECDLIPRSEVRDECEESYAFKQKDPTLCAAVKDVKRKQYCEIRINTWLKYPLLRSSFYFGIPVPID